MAKKKKNKYLTIRREWTRKPLTHIKESGKIYKRSKKVDSDEESKD